MALGRELSDVRVFEDGGTLTPTCPAVSCRGDCLSCLHRWWHLFFTERRQPAAAYSIGHESPRRPVDHEEPDHRLSAAYLTGLIEGSSGIYQTKHPFSPSTIRTDIVISRGSCIIEDDIIITRLPPVSPPPSSSPTQTRSTSSASTYSCT